MICLPESGSKRSPLSETRNLGWETCINKPFTSLIDYPKPKLCLDSLPIKHQNLSCFVLSIPHKFLLSLSKKYKSCLLSPLFRLISMTLLCLQIKICFFSPINLFPVDFIISLGTRTQEDRQEISSSLTLTSLFRNILNTQQSPLNCLLRDFPGGPVVKNLPCSTGFDSWL